ncbi:hypothetical protein AVEN_109727-1 [Araneus ventricosus]|uniref:Uncharacterized protein n=1 Tax=Araneus ventricosus TaxID=182803 RepID=A0A4Y2SVD7_ARAVE|nr:hypothetical protein AVEN_109727-1 [Araneus ventricosus]
MILGYSLFFLSNNGEVALGRSGRESYGDSAIGYVQVKSENKCAVKAIVTPAHKISKKRDGATVICNEEDEVVLSALCDSCAGFCEAASMPLPFSHGFIDEVRSYQLHWKKSKLSTGGKSLKFVKGKDLGKRQVNQLSFKNGSFLFGVLKVRKEMGINDTILTKYYRRKTADSLITFGFLPVVAAKFKGCF